MDGTGLDAPFQSLAQVGGVHESSFVNENFWLFHLVEKTILLLESRRKGGREGEGKKGGRKEGEEEEEEEEGEGEGGEKEEKEGGGGKEEGEERE